MKNNFLKSLNHVLIFEGGFSYHPEDPGGLTNQGITFETFRMHRGEDVIEEDLLNMTSAERDTIYRRGYWEACKCDDLPAGLDYAVFDMAVNAGPLRAARLLQNVVGAKIDYIIGPETLRKVGLWSAKNLIERLCSERLEFYQGLSGWDTFGRGWKRRIEYVQEAALKMAEADEPKAVKYRFFVTMYRTFLEDGSSTYGLQQRISPTFPSADSLDDLISRYTESLNNQSVRSVLILNILELSEDDFAQFAPETYAEYKNEQKG